MIQTLTLPTGLAHFDQGVDLEGVTYLLTLRWNAREAMWSLDVSTADGVLLVAGVACVVNRFLLRRYRYIAGLPPGDLMFLDLTETLDAPGYTFDAELTYFTADELATS